MKIMILAIDALEFNLVKRWRFKGLQQNVSGWVDVSDFKRLLTPVVFASFITGKPPSVHGIDNWWVFSTNTKMNSLIYWARKKIPIIKSMSHWDLERTLAPLHNIFGIKINTPQSDIFKRKGLNTIFDYASNPIAINVPSYNEDVKTRLRYSMSMKKGIKTFENEIWSIHKERVEKIMSNLDYEWDLFMAWIDLADLISHLYLGKNNLKMYKTYNIIENLIHNIKIKIPKNTLFMIISDHGMEVTSEGIPIHSKRAFYSFNMDLGWRPKTIMDYANFIIKSI